MYSQKTTQAFSMNEKDIKTFRYLLIGFVILQIIGLILYLFRPVYSAIFYGLGSLAFILGIILLSRKYKQLTSGIKISILFIIALIGELVVAEFNNLYPHSSHISPTVESVQSQLLSIQNGFGQHIFSIVLFVFLTGLLMFLTGYFLTPWINQLLNLPKRQFKSFLYFGIIFGLGDLITGIGYFLYDRDIRFVINNTRPLTSLGLSGLIILLGVILLLIAFVIEIIIGLKLYSNLSSLMGTKKIPFDTLGQETKFCKNCGSRLEENAKICHVCGLEVESLSER